MRGLCMKRPGDRQTLTCSKKSRQNNSFCIINESLSWINHRDTCVLHGGILPYIGYMTDSMEANIPYTFGTFRTFTPVPKQAHSAASPCLAVTRVGKELWLEPEDCAAKRRYLCNTEQNFDYYSIETSSSYFNEENITRETTESDAKRRDMCSQTIIIILAMISGFAIITVIVLGVRLKRSCTMNVMHSSIANKMYEDLQSRNTSGDYSTVQETGMNN
ncbi:hypothetical protein DPMN_079915 [Dreissena polymorpha]|uniref:C-type lectin domain-containing protein n=1 Tax=Dreissena polymorpha TaxID=45954 RepID=A0A9D4BQI6_DREPO|nr:hypothetical protein DPMN_079915 [Dreissena polymorpha]